MADALTGYATLIGYFGHAVGRTNEELKPVVGAAREFQGPGFLLPAQWELPFMRMACASSIR